MKYVVRALKYFLFITIIFALVLWVLACYVSGRFVYTADDILATLVNGIKSVWLILGVFAAVAAIYPMLGYMRFPLRVAGSVADNKEDLKAFMDEKGYRYEKETEDSICFRLRKGWGRLTRTFEDRITVTQGANGLEMEGVRKDVVRLANSYETRHMGSIQE